MVRIVFCLPGQTYSRDFLLAWTDLVMQSASRGHQIMVSQQPDRFQCLGAPKLGQDLFDGTLEYDVMMWIDPNIAFRPDDFFNLLESPYDVTGGVYMVDENLFDTVYKWEVGPFKKLRSEDIVGASQYMPVDYTGMGWMLIRKGVLERLKYPWIYPSIDDNGVRDEEASFARALKSEGIQVYIDTQIRVGNYKRFII